MTPEAMANSMVPLLVCSALVCAQMNKSALCEWPEATQRQGKLQLAYCCAESYLIQTQQVGLA